MPRVLHIRRFHTGGVFIGRGSRWGNPFRIGADGTRDEVILAYFEYLKTQPDLLLALDDLRGHDLLCYCSPLPCHGDILLALAGMSIEDRSAFLDIPIEDYPKIILDS